MGAEGDAQGRLLRLLGGKWITAALSAAAELGIADVLTEGPLPVEALAARVGAHPDALRRLLHVLAGEEVVALNLDGSVHLTELGAGLTRGQLGELARFVGADFMWAPWSALPQALRSGQAAFELCHGSALFDYLDGNRGAADLYHTAVDAFTRREARALSEVFDFGPQRRVVDVGGGLGTLLLELRARFAHLECVLFDRPSVIAMARQRLADQAREAAFELVGGDFLEDDPPAGDVYVIKHVLHNWDDARAQTLLRRCVRRLRPGGRVLIIEGILLPGNRRDGARLMDLEMLVLCGGGRERTKPEFRALLRGGGLKLVSTHDLAGTSRLIVAEPR